jgi:hypothetical protein
LCREGRYSRKVIAFGHLEQLHCPKKGFGLQVRGNRQIAITLVSADVYAGSIIEAGWR